MQADVVVALINASAWSNPLWVYWRWVVNVTEIYNRKNLAEKKYLLQFSVVCHSLGQSMLSWVSLHSSLSLFSNTDEIGWSQEYHHQYVSLQVVYHLKLEL